MKKKGFAKIYKELNDPLLNSMQNCGKSSIKNGKLKVLQE